MQGQLQGGRPRADAPRPVATYEVRGGGGVRLYAREWGDPQGPELLLIHGWSQSDLCWTKQVQGDLAARFRIITFDLRGHGLSEKPGDAANYTDPRVWADDVAAVLEQTGLERPVVAAWSYGGFLVTDYIRAHGDAALGAINLVGATVISRRRTLDHVGPGLLANAGGASESDLATNIGAMQRFLRACTVAQLDEREWTTALCWNMVVPPGIRGALISREIDGSDALQMVSVPVLVTHGRQDAIVLPSMAEHMARMCDTAVISWYDDVGHMPFWEAAERFDRELAELSDRARLETART